MRDGSYLRNKRHTLPMARDALVLGGLFAAVFGVMILLSNPIDFQQFPLNVSIHGVIGLALFMGGVTGMYYGAKD